MNIKEKENELVKFKQDMFDLKNLAGIQSGKHKDKYSYLMFIDFAFREVIQYLQAFYVIGGDVEFSDSMIESFDGVKQDARLDKLFTTYCKLVKINDPFTDLFSLFHEELLLSDKYSDDLGKFYTPPDFSYLMAELMPVLSSTSYFGDVCSGAGSLNLAALRRCALENPDALGSIVVVLDDIDELACKVAFIQIATNILVHRMQIGLVEVYKCNLLTEWRKPGTLMVRYKAPESIVKRSIRAGKVKAFNEVMKLCK